jgi:hypothetical protein
LKLSSEEKNISIIQTFEWFLSLESGMTFVEDAEYVGHLCFPID